MIPRFPSFGSSLARRGPFLATLLGLSAAAMAAPLRYAEDRAPAVVNPLFATTMSEARINELLFESLFTDDLELKSSGALAASSVLAPDRRSMTIEMRPGVRWHDGKSVSAKDVVFTIDAMKNPATASSDAGRVLWIKRAVAESDLRVKLEFEGEEYAPADKLHFKILPSHKFVSTAVKRTDAFRAAPLGCGPWKFVSFNPDNSISMQRVEDHYTDPKLEQVDMREVADKNYQAKLLMYESLEALVRVLPRDIASLQNDRKIELYPYQTNSWWYLGYNLAQPRFKDVRVRQALHALIDVNQLLAPIGTGEVITGPFVPSSPFYNHDVQMTRPDATQSASLLQQAGYTLVGRQWMNGTEPLKVRIAAPDNLETAQDVLINVQSMLQSYGIAVEPVFLGPADWRQKIWKDRDFDLVLSQWSFDRNEDIYEQFHSKGTRNFVGYANPNVDRLLDEARKGADPQKKKAILREVHATIAKDEPMVFLWTLDSYSALSTKVKNVVIHPFYFFTWAEEWSIPS